MPVASLDIQKIFLDYKSFNFVEDVAFYWSAKSQSVHYVGSELNTHTGLYRLLHEIGHAVCNHHTFQSGIALLSLEVEAWEKAVEISKIYDISIPEDHIEQCLDSYRDWLHKRSTCPDCTTISVEHEPNRYRCFNCLRRWTVSGNQLLRCYRQTA